MLDAFICSPAETVSNKAAARRLLLAWHTANATNTLDNAWIEDFASASRHRHHVEAWSVCIVLVVETKRAPKLACTSWPLEIFDHTTVRRIKARWRRVTSATVLCPCTLPHNEYIIAVHDLFSVDKSANRRQLPANWLAGLREVRVLNDGSRTNVMIQS
jgi:hypothetical protein